MVVEFSDDEVMDAAEFAAFDAALSAAEVRCRKGCASARIWELDCRLLRRIQPFVLTRSS